MWRHLIGVVLLFGFTLYGSVTVAQADLTIQASGGENAVALSLADLQALPQHDVKTANEFVDGIRTFRGPLLRDVLNKYGGAGAVTALFTAINDYQSEAPVAEFYKYDAILALSMDGEPFSSRDKGPIWVIYPMSDHPESQDPAFNNRLVWQLVRIDYR